MSAAFFVSDACEKARWMIRQESRGPGDTRNAMDRLSLRYGLPQGLLWSLRYRQPKDLFVSAYAALCEAHEKECGRVGGLLDEEFRKTKPTSLVGRALVRAAAALGGAESAAVDAGGADAAPR